MNEKKFDFYMMAWNYFGIFSYIAYGFITEIKFGVPFIWGF